MSEKTVTGEPSGVSLCVADNPTEMSSLVIVDKHIAVSCCDDNSLLA
ncbi:hypothetical protein AD34_4686 [Escherichia coli 5-172-05_S4_C3]|nr:hypothetical protein SFy_1464 [Shigella flexneri 2003036]AIL40003.1 hypothetical protein SFyv_1513 [Shigella flexneri Shi06HN006]EGJ92485.1 hypothetical protein SFK671_1240 [Shigella flexneri K-671]EGK38979.1 hypothetical protein SFK304_1400 [Shigella flexneri K-304]EHU57173.1 hypothetical protein ECDEC2E_2301 [Escherichia coli DEC2E]EHV53655.1 hypothetical protein ECDEC6C_4933 [Escherichia coli DEC6C]EIQ15405.1 hypothetical protein SFK1770_1613 [Shigella flexneri K-1770]EIQ30639.1 hypoth